ncbi:hypothetical protein Hanom_Chr16g01458971 [Helianthus anomalus]
MLHKLDKPFVLVLIHGGIFWSSLQHLPILSCIWMSSILDVTLKMPRHGAIMALTSIDSGVRYSAASTVELHEPSSKQIATINGMWVQSIFPPQS